MYSSVSCTGESRGIDVPYLLYGWKIMKMTSQTKATVMLNEAILPPEQTTVELLVIIVPVVISVYVHISSDTTDFVDAPLALHHECHEYGLSLPGFSPGIYYGVGQSMLLYSRRYPPPPHLNASLFTETNSILKNVWQ